MTTDAIEAYVRTVIARVLDVPPGNVRPETMLLAGVVTYEQLCNIAHRIEWGFVIEFAADEAERWTTVADVVLATERAVRVDQERAFQATAARVLVVGYLLIAAGANLAGLILRLVPMGHG